MASGLLASGSVAYGAPAAPVPVGAVPTAAGSGPYMPRPAKPQAPAASPRARAERSGGDESRQLRRHASHGRNTFGAIRPRQAGTALVNESFEGPYVSDPRFMPLDSACLTGAGGPPPPGASALGPCASSIGAPPPGVTPGYLQLTDDEYFQRGGVVYNQAIPATAGLQVQFDQYQYGGRPYFGRTGDGISFFLSDGSKELMHTGGTGGSLGYAQRYGEEGVNGGYLGVGFDAFGNYSQDTEGRGTGCTQRSPVTAEVPNVVALRGPGQGLIGYCWLTGTVSGTTSTLPGMLAAPTLDAARRTTQVTVSPGTFPTVTVAMDFHDGNGFRHLFSYTMTQAAPRTYKFGFAASTGGATDVHLIRNLTVDTVNPLTGLSLVKQVDRTTPQPGSYQVGDTVPYQFVATNGGVDELTNLEVTDPAVTDIHCPTTTLAPAGEAGSSVTCTGTHTLTAADIGPNATFTNTATATATDATTGTQVTAPPSTVSVPVTTPETQLHITKTAEPDSVRPGDRVNYTITVHNQGPPVTGATITDDLSNVLDRAVYNHDAEATTGTVSVHDTTLTWTGDLTTGATATITFSITVDTRNSTHSTLTNKVTGPTGSNCTAGSTDPACTTTTTVTPVRPPKPCPPHKPRPPHKHPGKPDHRPNKPKPPTDKSPDTPPGTPPGDSGTEHRGTTEGTGNPATTNS